jgi:hypothetical protein
MAVTVRETCRPALTPVARALAETFMAELRW